MSSVLFSWIAMFLFRHSSILHQNKQPCCFKKGISIMNNDILIDDDIRDHGKSTFCILNLNLCNVTYIVLVTAIYTIADHDQ